MTWLLLACRWTAPEDTASVVDTAPVEDSAVDTDPAEEEICDGIDNDLDGLVDEDFPDDADGDGSAACFDCDDTDPLVGGRMPEVCDGQDNDCDGDIDEDFDQDGDGWSTCAADCDDDDPDRYPGAQELCDGLDNDCDELTVETDDLDGDGYTRCDGDCDETDEDVNPGVAEVCDGEDNDCDGSWDDAPECWDCTEVDDWLVCETSGPWSYGEQACRGMGLQLAVLDDEATQAEALAATLTVTEASVWIGLTDVEDEGTWVWVDGEVADWTNWAPHQPDNWSESEHCASMNWKDAVDGTWNDASCTYWQGFVCGD